MLLLLTTVLACARPQTPAAPEWVGCWRATDGSQQVMLLEPGRAGWLREGAPSFYRLASDGGTLTLERWSNLTELRARLGEDGRLRVQGDKLDLLLEACATPDALQVLPYAWPEGVEVDGDTVHALGIDLAARIVEDQRVRQFSGQPSQAQMEEMRAVDEDNLAFLLEIVGELGWIDAERFGTQAANDAFLIVQHGPDLRLMRSALPRIEADVRAGRLGGQAYALLFDRFQLNLGYLQRYGSQIGRSERFGQVLMPCEDIDSIDALRAEMGMGPLADYLALVASGPEATVPRHLSDLWP